MTGRFAAGWSKFEHPHVGSCGKVTASRLNLASWALEWMSTVVKWFNLVLVTLFRRCEHCPAEILPIVYIWHVFIWSQFVALTNICSALESLTILGCPVTAYLSSSCRLKTSTSLVYPTHLLLWRIDGYSGDANACTSDSTTSGSVCFYKQASDLTPWILDRRYCISLALSRPLLSVSISCRSTCVLSRGLCPIRQRQLWNHFFQWTSPSHALIWPKGNQHRNRLHHAKNR